MKQTDLAVKSKPAPDAEWHGMAQDISIGKDVLELLSASMYVDPLTVYREYIQNAADAIDEARSAGILDSDEQGRVQIHIDLSSRSVRIRDNGTGIRSKEFAARLTAIG